MKRVSKPNITSTVDTFQVPPIKLPSTLALPKDVVESLPCIPELSLYVPFGERPSTFQEVLNPWYGHVSSLVLVDFLMVRAS